MNQPVVSRYQDLETFRLAQNLAVKIHTLPLRRSHGEQGGQASALRRIARAAAEHIVAAADRPLPRPRVVRDLVWAQGACDEARVHLDLLRLTGALGESHYRTLHDGYMRLSRMLALLVMATQARGQAALWATLVQTGIP